MELLNVGGRYLKCKQINSESSHCDKVLQNRTGHYDLGWLMKWQGQYKGWTRGDTAAVKPELKACPRQFTPAGLCCGVC